MNNISRTSIPINQATANVSKFAPSESSVVQKKFTVEPESNHPFFEQLRAEKIRAQRSKTSLSILLITLESSKALSIRELSKFVRTRVRETDIVGYIDQETLGVILPYTDENGAKKSANNILSAVIKPQFSISTSTYPDEIFESLSLNGGVTPDVSNLVLEDSLSHSEIGLFLKRGIDIVGALTGIVVLSPLMLVIAYLIKKDSPGKVIFKQKRIGEKGVPFDFYKFRSMYANNNDQIHRDYVQNLINGNTASINQGDESKPFFKMKADPRITPIGRFIRKTSIDELPQLFNVLKGEMSLVGPRPPLPYEVEKYKSWHLKRVLAMKPGITGLWQVEGRGRTEFDESVRLDVRYLKHWSLWLDVKILFKTVKEVLLCRGAV